VKAKSKNKKLKPTDGYKYEVFISYRRCGLWPEWVENTFMPLFRHYLELEIPSAKVFIDYEMETGTSWPTRLANGLSHSKVLVGLWTKPYFCSKWCLAELSLMYAREKLCKFNTQNNPQRLIIPATLHDGDDFPESANQIQQKKLNKYSHVWLAEGSKTREDLSKIICSWMPDIRRAIEIAPQYKAEWATIAYKKIMRNFRIQDGEQDTTPNVGSS
jgi:hypothetical protein